MFREEKLGKDRNTVRERTPTPMSQTTRDVPQALVSHAARGGIQGPATRNHFNEEEYFGRRKAALG